MAAEERLEPEKRKFPPKFQDLIEQALEDPDKYNWFFDVEDCDQRQRKKKRKPPKIDLEKFNSLDGVTFLERCLNNKRVFYHGGNKEPTTVYILGTDHEHFYSGEILKQAIEELKPDVIATEDHMDFESRENHEKMMDIMRKYNGEISQITKNEDLTTLKELILCPGWDAESNDCPKLLLEWGHLNNVDSLMTYWMAEQHDIKIKEIDVSDHVFDHKLASSDSGIFKVEAIKYLYGFDCDDSDPMFDVDMFLDMLEAAQPTMTCGIGELCRQLEIQYNSGAYILETHIRDMFMARRIQEVCSGNPGKTILCPMGADHVYGVHQFFNKRIPTRLAQCIQNGQKSRKQLWKELKKYGCDRNNLCNLSKFQDIGLPSA